MGIFSLFKNLVSSTQIIPLKQKNIEQSSIESIEFPSDYIDIKNPIEIPEIHTIPDNNGKNLNGLQFGQSILDIPATQQRDDIIYQQCINGNIPNWMKNFQPIEIEDKQNKLIYFVSPDVLCIGSDQDFLRVSLAFSILLSV
jgi:hypothetical protein